MTDKDRPWPDLAKELRASLASGLTVGGTVDQAEVMTNVGLVGLDMIIESSDLEAEEQTDAYRVLNDLLITRLTEGADQVMGCLVFATDPDPSALASALHQVGGGDDNPRFAPILPLGRAQAETLAQAGMSIDTIIDAATDLIAVAADRRPPTVEDAETLLAELDELIDRQVGR